MVKFQNHIRKILESVWSFAGKENNCQKEIPCPTMCKFEYSWEEF